MGIRQMMYNRRAKPQMIFYHSRAPLKRLSKRAYLFNVGMFLAALLLCVITLNAQ